jgi:uncharacterized membrane protein
VTASGGMAEEAAGFFGTPQYIVGQTIVVIFWIILNSIAIVESWDPQGSGGSRGS